MSLINEFLKEFGDGGKGAEAARAESYGGTRKPKVDPTSAQPAPAQATPGGSLGNAPKASFGKKVKTAAKNIATGQTGFGTTKQKKFEGGVLGAIGGAAKGAGEELSRFRSEKAGAGGGQTQQPEQSGADQDIFGQQASRSRGGGQTGQQRRITGRAFGNQGAASKQSPQNVQNRPRPGVAKSFNPALASLLAVSAGFAASDAVVNASGARGARSITDDQLNLFNVMANKRRGRKLRKEHAPLPPIQGLVWDEGAKRWRKPENVGKTASEVQGKKRIRGSAIGQTAKTPGGTAAGKGRGRAYSRGRAQRVAAGDIGVAGTDASKLSSKRRRKKRG